MLGPGIVWESTTRPYFAIYSEDIRKNSENTSWKCTCEKRSKTLRNVFYVNWMHWLRLWHGNHTARGRRECHDPWGNRTPRMNCRAVGRQCPNEWGRRGREFYVISTANAFEAKLKTKLRKTKTRMRFRWTQKKTSDKKNRKRKKRQQKCESRLYFF